MDLIHPVIPPLAILLGAGTLTLARYRVAPMIWRLSSHSDRYALLVIAFLLAVGYSAIRPTGPLAQVTAASSQIANLTGIVLLGLGAGFLIVGLLLLFRRSE